MILLKVSSGAKDGSYVNCVHHIIQRGVRTSMNRVLGAVGAGIIGSTLFFAANFFFGGDQDSAFQASKVGFFIFLIIGFFAAKLRS